MPSFVTFSKSFPYTFPITFGEVGGAVFIGDYAPDPEVAYREASLLARIASVFFEPDPSTWFDPMWMAAIDQQNYQTPTIPVLPIPYVYALPSFFHVNDPADHHVFYEAWQNQSATLMPIYTSEELHGPRHNWPYLAMQIARPVFLPDGVGVTSPTKAEPVNLGRDDLTLAPL